MSALRDSSLEPEALALYRELRLLVPDLLAEGTAVEIDSVRSDCAVLAEALGGDGELVRGLRLVAAWPEHLDAESLPYL